MLFNRRIDPHKEVSPGSTENNIRRRAAMTDTIKVRDVSVGTLRVLTSELMVLAFRSPRVLPLGVLGRTVARRRLGQGISHKLSAPGGPRVVFSHELSTIFTLANTCVHPKVLATVYTIVTLLLLVTSALFNFLMANDPRYYWIIFMGSNMTIVISLILLANSKFIEAYTEMIYFGTFCCLYLVANSVFMVYYLGLVLLLGLLDLLMELLLAFSSLVKQVIGYGDELLINTMLYMLWSYDCVIYNWGAIELDYLTFGDILVTSDKASLVTKLLIPIYLVVLHRFGSMPAYTRCFTETPEKMGMFLMLTRKKGHMLNRTRLNRFYGFHYAVVLVSAILIVIHLSAIFALGCTPSYMILDDDDVKALLWCFIKALVFVFALVELVLVSLYCIKLALFLGANFNAPPFLAATLAIYDSEPAILGLLFVEKLISYVDLWGRWHSEWVFIPWLMSEQLASKRVESWLRRVNYNLEPLDYFLCLNDQFLFSDIMFLQRFYTDYKCFNTLKNRVQGNR